MKVKQLVLPLMLAAFTITLTTGCGAWWLPKAHKIDIQQGNLLPPAQVDQVVEGMTKSQVISLLGEPVATNFFDRQRWDYIYSTNLAGETPKAKTLTLHFQNDQIVSIEKEGL